MVDFYVSRRKKIMKKYLVTLASFMLALLIGVSTGTVSATPRDMAPDPGNGGYPNVYYGGTFRISSTGGVPIMDVNHYAYADSSNTLKTNGISIYSSTFYPSNATYPTIVSQDVNNSTRVAWVKARTYYSRFPEKGYFEGQHGFNCSSSNKL